MTTQSRKFARATEPNAAASEPDAAAGVLVSPEWLEAHLDDPAVRIVEVDVSPARHDERHIPGAVLWNVYRDLKDADYRMVDAPALERLLSGSGVSPDSTVVVYGYAPAMGFWLMKLYGHRDVRILNCSRDAWFDAGRAASSTVTSPDPVGYELGDADRRLRATHEAVAGAIGRPGTAIVDVRSEPEYVGERFWPSGGLEPNGRAGHVPTAVWQPVDDIYSSDGSFLSAGQLRDVFSAVDLGGTDELITYCTIGGRACTAWFILTHVLGRDGVRVYDGSWAEWGFMADAPVEQGGLA
jgi:thiosulfate/3-mercaptopyruvate sulfurtransferase